MAEATQFLFDLQAREVSGGGYGGGNAGPDAMRERGPSAVPPELPRSDHSRGLALASFKLEKSFEPRLFRWVNRENEVVVIASSFDGSGGPPFVFPVLAPDIKPYVPLKVGETYQWTLGDGFPVFRLAKSLVTQSLRFKSPSPIKERRKRARQSQRQPRL